MGGMYGCGKNVWVWLVCMVAVSGCCCKEVYRFPHMDQLHVS